MFVFLLATTVFSVVGVGLATDFRRVASRLAARNTRHLWPTIERIGRTPGVRRLPELLVPRTAERAYARQVRVARLVGVIWVLVGVTGVVISIGRLIG